MGEAIRKYNIPRAKVVLMSKCYRVVCDEENYDVGSGVAMLNSHVAQSKDYVNSWGADAVAYSMPRDITFN